MSDGNSIINLGDLAKPATVLIEKVSNAVGVLYEPNRIIKKAEAEANKIKTIASFELNEIEQRGIERLVHQEARKQENIEKITLQATKSLPSDAKPEMLDEDWVAHFFDKCDKVSDVQMQSLWSKLLAGEATSPGTYSKRTVDFITAMDKKDAELFTQFCQFTWLIGQATPLIFDHKDEIYKNNGINFSSLTHLDSIGLISFNQLSGYRKIISIKNCVICYFGKPTMIEFTKDKDNSLSTGQAMFTQAGKELVNICGAARNEEFYQYAIEQIGSQEVSLSSMLLYDSNTVTAKV